MIIQSLHLISNNYLRSQQIFNQEKNRLAKLTNYDRHQYVVQKEQFIKKIIAKIIN